MKLKFKIIIAIFAVLFALLVADNVRLRTNKVFYIDASKVSKIVMIQKDRNEAKVVKRSDHIENICKSFNSLKLKYVKDEDRKTSDISGRVGPITFRFVLTNSLIIEIVYVGNAIGFAGKEYDINDFSINDYWELDYRLYYWWPDRMNLKAW